MQILITDSSLVRTRALHLRRWHVVLGALLISGVLMVIAALVYHYFFLTAAREGWPVASQLVKLMVRDELQQQERVMRDNLDAIAQRVGEMQAKLVKLEALGERVTGMVLLQSIDSHWREHLAALDYLRQGIHLRGYAQKNPKQEYKREAFELFAQLLDLVKLEVTRLLMTVRIQSQEQVSEAAQAIEERASQVSNVTYTHPNEDGSVSEEADRDTQVLSVPKVGRNDPCPCGSGKKYKHCHGKYG